MTSYGMGVIKKKKKKKQNGVFYARFSDSLGVKIHSFVSESFNSLSRSHFSPGVATPRLSSRRCSPVMAKQR